MIYCTGVRSYQDGGSKFINYSIRWNLDHWEIFFGRGHPNNRGPSISKTITFQINKKMNINEHKYLHLFEK